MNEVERIVALCRTDPEVASLSLLIAACLYGIVAILLGMIPQYALGALGRLLPVFDDSALTGHVVVILLRAFCIACAVTMGIGGATVEIARRLGLLPALRA